MQAELRDCSWRFFCSRSSSSGLRCRQAAIPSCFASARLEISAWPTGRGCPHLNTASSLLLRARSQPTCATSRSALSTCSRVLPRRRRIPGERPPGHWHAEEGGCSQSCAAVVCRYRSTCPAGVARRRRPGLSKGRGRRYRRARRRTAARDWEQPLSSACQCPGHGRRVKGAFRRRTRSLRDP